MYINIYFSIPLYIPITIYPVLPLYIYLFLYLYISISQYLNISNLSNKSEDIMNNVGTIYYTSSLTYRNKLIYFDIFCYLYLYILIDNMFQLLESRLKLPIWNFLVDLLTDLLTLALYRGGFVPKKSILCRQKGKWAVGAQNIRYDFFRVRGENFCSYWWGAEWRVSRAYTRELKPPLVCVEFAEQSPFNVFVKIGRSLSIRNYWQGPVPVNKE